MANLNLKLSTSERLFITGILNSQSGDDKFMTRVDDLCEAIQFTEAEKEVISYSEASDSEKLAAGVDRSMLVVNYDRSYSDYEWTVELAKSDARFMLDVLSGYSRYTRRDKWRKAVMEQLADLLKKKED